MQGSLKFIGKHFLFKRLGEEWLDDLERGMGLGFPGSLNIPSPFVSKLVCGHGERDDRGDFINAFVHLKIRFYKQERSV